MPSQSEIENFRLIRKQLSLIVEALSKLAVDDPKFRDKRLDQHLNKCAADAEAGIFECERLIRGESED